MYPFEVVWTFWHPMESAFSITCRKMCKTFVVLVILLDIRILPKHMSMQWACDLWYSTCCSHGLGFKDIVCCRLYIESYTLSLPLSLYNRMNNIQVMEWCPGVDVEEHIEIYIYIYISEGGRSSLCNNPSFFPRLTFRLQGCFNAFLYPLWLLLTFSDTLVSPKHVNPA